MSTIANLRVSHFVILMQFSAIDKEIQEVLTHANIVVQVSAALVDPQRGGQTTLSASQVADGSKRHRNVEFGTPYKRPMASSGRLSVDMMVMMISSK
ncbi:jg15129 [Pararge aegeria aegeria]|uniref:Jg15129 protein n=1 Tax=Pararge aegeria aegeria TaxID=348720 RepID=A0A8S4QXA3_9NEOP|nr:jg15129 [Pararge aegeria aegeria]